MHPTTKDLVDIITIITNIVFIIVIITIIAILVTILDILVTEIMHNQAILLCIITGDYATMVNMGIVCHSIHNHPIIEPCRILCIMQYRAFMLPRGSKLQWLEDMSGELPLLYRLYLC